jgi:hypothetical protein
MGISIADFNNDGWPDVFIANDTEPNSLFINRGNGTFEEKGWNWESPTTTTRTPDLPWGRTPKTTTTTATWISSITT